MMTNYPQSIKEQLKDIVDILNQEGLLDEYGINEDTVNEVFGKELFELWLKGVEPIMEDNEFDDLLNRCIITECIKQMEKEGLVGSIDIDGEEKIFLTEKGKKEIKKDDHI